jgi:hypothetical protein
LNYFQSIARWSVAVLSGLAVVVAAAPALSHAQTKPAGAASKPAQRPGKQQDPADKAVKELLKEARESARGKKPFPRTASDYFAKSTDEKPTEQQILGQLRKGLDRNPLIDAYVKWQLLSAVPAKFAAERTEEAVRALVNAPSLPPLPGAVDDVKQRLREALGRMRSDREGALDEESAKMLDAVNTGLASETNRVLAENKLLVDYRNELIKRIPDDDEKQKVLLMKARMEDLSQRAGAGHPTLDAFKILAAEIRTWAVTANKGDIGRMAEFVGEYTQRSPAQVFEQADWDRRKRAVVWRTRLAGLDKKVLDSLQADLRAAVNNAGSF